MALLLGTRAQAESVLVIVRVAARPRVEERRDLVGERLAWYCDDASPRSASDGDVGFGCVAGHVQTRVTGVKKQV